MRFLSPEVTLYLRLLSISWDCHVWSGASSYYLELLDKLRKRTCRIISPSLASFIEALAHRRNVASLSIRIRITLVDVHLNWPNCFHFLILERGLFVILIDSMISATIASCYKVANVNSFFPCTARFWNSLPIECFPFTYDLNGFKSGIIRHLLIVSFSFSL